MLRNRWKIILAMLATAVLIALLVPKTAKFSYDYKKGQPWKYDNLYALFDFPLIKTDDQILEERVNSTEKTVPYYKYSTEVVNRNLKQAERLELGKYKSAVISELRTIYEKGVVGDDEQDVDAEVIYIQREKRASKRPATDIYRLTEARAKLLADMLKIGGGESVDSLFREQGVYELIAPNLLYDSQTTALVKAQSEKSVSPTAGFVSAGELIVSQGELVTAEVSQMLDSYKKEYEISMGYSRSPFIFWLGNLLLATAILVVFYFVVHYVTPHAFNDSRIYYLLLVFAVASAVALIIARINEEFLYLVPFTLAAIFLQAFFRPKLIMGIYVVSLLPLLVFTRSGVVPFFTFLIAGITAIYFFGRFNKGWSQFVAALAVFIVLAVVFMACYMTEMTTLSPLRVLIYLFISALLNIAGYPLVYLFEKMFNLVSNSRLAELCDTTNPLIRELEHKAPGTFQHSLQVMNLADAAARSIDANPVRVRAGALYHDIGKIANPQCFVENESLIAKAEEEKYHTNLQPEQSAQDIIKHVTDGVEVARRYRLPQLIVNYILSHHGTTTTGYFYQKYLNAGGSPDSIREFTYPGKKPVTKEETILMLCDSIEAASRTLKDYSPESVSEFVERIVKSKMDEHQFDDAEISISELGTVKATVKNYLAQMHHERIVYPKRNNQHINK